MSDARVLHKKAGGSRKVNSLTNLEYRVWTQYLVSADDFGVMPATAAIVQADNLYLRREKTKRVQAAIDQLVAVGLLMVFDHQHEFFLWQPDWQKWQGIRYPRTTCHPAPPPAALQQYADTKTRELFQHHSAHSQIDFSENVNSFPQPAGAGGRETLTHTQEPNSDSHPEKMSVYVETSDLSPTGLMERWNVAMPAPIPQCRELTPQRKRHALARLHERRDGAEWEAILTRIAMSRFCRGENDRGWVATFDWLLKPDVPVKVLEGKYDNRERTPNGRESATKHTLEAARAVLGALNAKDEAM